MTSTTTNQAHLEAGSHENEPLLGRPGDASQQDGMPLYHNLVVGTAVLAQAGAWILAAVVWSAVFSHPILFMSSHPLLNSAAIVLFAQGVLIVQPTHTARQKKEGTWAHAAFNDAGLVALIAGLVIIEVNKFRSGGQHFHSVHAILGAVVYVLIMLQAAVGFTAYFTPGLYGGVDNSKALYKYHRWSGYAVFTLLLATVCAATQTDYNKNVLHIQLWATVVASVLTTAGLLARVKKAKLGL